MKNKKFLLSIFIAGFLILPAFVFGAINYERDPSGYTITSPIHFDISFDDISEICYGDPPNEPTGNWKVRIWDWEGENAYDSEQFSTNSVSFDMDLPIEEYALVCAYCEKPATWTEDYDFEGDIYEWYVIFEIVEEIPPPAGIWITFPALDFATSLKATAGDVFSDLTIPIVIIVCLPIAFWFLAKVIEVIQGSLIGKEK